MLSSMVYLTCDVLLSVKFIFGAMSNLGCEAPKEKVVKSSYLSPSLVFFQAKP